MRSRVHVLPKNQPVPERKDVDAVPLAVAGPRRPLADGEVVAGTQAPRREVEVGIGGEDAGDVCADGVSFGALVRRVVFEDHPVGVEGTDRVDIVGVPRVVVPLDQLADTHLHRGTLA